MADDKLDEHAAVEAEFSDYHDKALSTDRVREVQAHLATCDRCRGEYARFEKALGALSGLLRVPAPTDLQDQVAATIHRRSAGRFFGRRHLPFQMIAVLSLIALATVYYLLWMR